MSKQQNIGGFFKSAPAFSDTGAEKAEAEAKEAEAPAPAPKAQRGTTTRSRPAPAADVEVDSGYGARKRQHVTDKEGKLTVFVPKELLVGMRRLARDRETLFKSEMSEALAAHLTRHGVDLPALRKQLETGVTEEDV